MIKYFQSEILDKKCKYDTDTGIVTVKDICILNPNKHIEYAASEIEILKNRNEDITPQLHNIKRYFGGEIIEYTKLTDLKMKGMP